VGVQQGVELEQGGGDDVDVRATVELSHTNLWGLGRSLSARIRGSRREQRFQTTYREPRLFNWDLDGFASFLIERTRRPQFDASRIDFSSQSLYQFPNEDNLLFTASFQTVNLRDIRVNPRAGTTDEIGTIQVSTIGASWVRDTRNAPFDPTRGNYFSGSFRLGHRAYGSEVNFTSVFTQVSLFRPARQTVIAGSARFGWNQPFGRAGDGSPQRLPITERYFAGGSTTLRAFDVDEAGVPGGGNAMFLLNLEYRYPLHLFLPRLSVAFLYDTGTVFDRISDFSVGDFTHTSGLGLRYLTPLGPVRVDFGLNLNRQESIGERAHRLHFTLGHAF
jgi:outer membrane protein insertion porin family